MFDKILKIVGVFTINYEQSIDKRAKYCYNVHKDL